MTKCNSPTRYLSVIALCVACSGGHEPSTSIATGGAAVFESGGASTSLGGTTSTQFSSSSGAFGATGGTATVGYGGASTSASPGGTTAVFGTSSSAGGTLATSPTSETLGGTSAVNSSTSSSSGKSSSGGASDTLAGGSSSGGAATGGNSQQGVPVAFVVQPTFLGNENPSVPQAGILRLQTDVAAVVEVAIAGGDEEWSLSLPAATNVEAPIVGLKPDTLYQVTVEVSAGANTLTAGPLEWRTPPLPDDFPPLSVAVSVPEQMEPGMTLFAPRDGWNMAQAPIIVVDHAGVVRWYFSDPQNLVQEDLRRLENGNFLFGRDFCSLREVDILGNVVGMWHAANYLRTCDVPTGSIPVPVNDFHHESRVISNGNILTLSTETRTVDGFPTSEDDAAAPTQRTLVMGSMIVEFTREGQIVKQISLLDLLDPTRIGRDSLDTSWPSSHVARGQRAQDWDHANAVIFDLASDSYYVSLRHQDAVVKVNRSTETLTWILGTPANWKAPWSDKLLIPEGELSWPFHQHAVELNALGLGLYDNGNYRAAAYESYDASEAQYSRVVAYAIDEQAHTVKQVWSYGPTSGADSFYSEGMGDADWQPMTGNVVFDNAQIFVPGPDRLSPGTTHAQILEVKPDGTRVFDLSVQGPEGSAYPVYRADRIADIRN